jgi:hypothetical protein
MAVGEKVMHFQGKSTDLGELQQKVEGYLKSDGYTVQSSPPSGQGSVTQAKKGGVLAGIIAADRALTVWISGASDDFTVRVGIGKWVEHLGVTAVETLLLSQLFLVVDVGEMGWNFEIEDKLAKQIESFVGSSASASS